MATSAIRSCGVATESTVGSPATATGYPDASGLSYAILECRRASLTVPGEQPTVPREDARASAYIYPPEVAGIHSSGSPLRLRDATVTITCPLRTIGAASAFANYAAMPLGRLLASGFGVSTPGASTDTVALSVSESVYTSDDATDTDVGDIIKIERDASGRVSFAGVTNSDGGGTENVTISPAAEAALTTNDVIRLCQTYYSVLGTSTLGSSVALRLDGDGWRSYLVGARWQTIRLYAEGRLVMVDITIQGRVYDDHGSASVSDYTQADGAVAVDAGCYHVISSAAIGTTVPATLARTALALDAWEVTITNTLSPVGASDNALGYSDLEVTDQTVEGSVTITTPVSGYDDFLLDQEQRSIMLGFGPLGAGNGAAVYIPAATFTSDASMRSLDGERVTQVLNFGMGNWTLDSASTDAGDKNFRLGLSL